MGNECSCVLFLYGFYVSSWPKAPLISCYTAVSLGRAEENDRINVHYIWHLCPFARKGEDGLRSLLCVWWRAQNEVFLQQQYPRHPLQRRAISSWEAIPWEDAKSIGRTSCGKWVRLKKKKNGNELGKTLTKLRETRLKSFSVHLSTCFQIQSIIEQYSEGPRSLRIRLIQKLTNLTCNIILQNVFKGFLLLLPSWSLISKNKKKKKTDRN